MPVHWSPEAAEDIERIVRPIQQDKPTAAREVATRLYDGITTRETCPNRGRIGWEKGTREDVLHSYHDAQNGWE